MKNQLQFSQPESHTHCQVARKSRPTSQNLSISMSFANAPKVIKEVANLKDKMTENKECQCLTKAIRNAGKVLNMNIVAMNEICSKRKAWCSKISHSA